MAEMSGGQSAENDAGIWGDFTRKCDRCGQTYGGSHYHCGGCDSLDVTGSYGHHTTFCKRTRSNREFHHCGPDGCALDTPIPPAETEEAR